MFERYHPRPLSYLGVEVLAGLQLKVYAIRYGAEPLDRGRFAAGWARLAADLPRPAVDEGRPGVGFVILHQGRTGNYLIAGWWDRENELPVRVYLGGPDGWRPAAGGESFCVWDLRVMWWEREAYVGTVLAGRADGVEAYLSAAVEGYA
jgi:hypothetical protein